MLWCIKATVDNETDFLPRAVHAYRRSPEAPLEALYVYGRISPPRFANGRVLESRELRLVGFRTRVAAPNLKFARAGPLRISNLPPFAAALSSVFWKLFAAKGTLFIQLLPSHNSSLLLLRLSSNMKKKSYADEFPLLANEGLYASHTEGNGMAPPPCTIASPPRHQIVLCANKFANHRQLLIQRSL